MKIRRILAVLLAAVFLCSTACAEGNLSELYQAVEQFIEATGNVTLTGRAAFTLNGDCFKTISLEYLRENDLDHYKDVNFWTKGKNGKPYESGYTILAKDGLADAWDKYSHYYERDVDYSERKSLLNRDTMVVYQEALKIVLGLAEGALQPFVTVENTQGKTTYWVAAEGRALPDVLRQAAETGIRFALSNYLYVHLPEYEKMPPYHSMDYSFLEMFPVLYQETYGEEMPEGFYERMSSLETGTDEEWERFGTVYGKCMTRVGKANQQYTDGYSVLHPDGTLDHYETYLEYLHGTESCYVQYEDYEAAVANFVRIAVEEGMIKQEETVGKTNYELAEELNMYDYYKALGVAQKAVVAYVREDGTCDFFASEFESSVEQADSVTMGIVNGIRNFELGEVLGNVTLDAEGRLVSAEGTVELLITAYDETVHSVVMTFSGAAENYGTTSLKTAEEAWNALQEETRPAP